jgi:hypothetical protein
MKWYKSLCRVSRFLGAVLTFVVLCFPLKITHAQPNNLSIQFSTPVLCGNGSESDNYGFSYSLQQPHWTVNGENYVSEDSLNQVDIILDRLNNDSIAQTMILFKRQDEVGNRVNCAVHFLRYMQLGLVEGERKDNGFVFLIVVEDGKIDVHYGVGLGLPALTAPELTDLNRLAEETYNNTHNMDQALMALIRGFDQVVRNKYTSLSPATPTPVNLNLPPLPGGPLGIGIVCCLVCVGIILLIVLVIVLSRLGRIFGGVSFPDNNQSWGDSPSPWSGPSSGGGGPVMRGGGGSGRSRRGN